MGRHARLEPTWEPVGLAVVKGAAHSAYREPSGWTSPPMCHPDRAAAEARARYLTELADAETADHRTWLITPCDGSTSQCPSPPATPAQGTDG
jgi:hypothetical protein